MSTKVSLLLFLTRFLLCYSNNYTGNTYFLRADKNGGIRVSRIKYLNHNITDYDYSHGRNKAVNVEVPKVYYQRPVLKPEPEKFFLDPEWDYAHKDFNKSDLPAFMNGFYKDFTGNTIRFLFNTNRNSTSGNIIKFNLDSVQPNENISTANLYLFWPLENSSSVFKTSVIMRLYQIQNPDGKELNVSTLIKNPDIHKLSNAIYMSHAMKGWQVFQIKKPIENWLKKKEKNLGLLLTISSYEEKKLLQVFNDTNMGMFRTVAVLSIKQNNTSVKNVTKANEENSAVVLNSQCKRRNWYVSFTKLHWDKLIIHPEDGFTTYDCTGRCSSFRDTEKNHGKMISLLGIRSSCCVPDTYAPMKIMYFDKYENIAIKSYNNMVVETCDCR